MKHALHAGFLELFKAPVVSNYSQFSSKGRDLDIHSALTFTFRDIIIPADDRTWHDGYQCHNIKEKYVESFLGHNVTDYIGTDLFSQMFKRGRPAVVATLIEEVEPRK